MLRKYIIEREVPGIGTHNVDGFCAIAQQSKNTLDVLGPRVQWLESFIVRGHHPRARPQCRLPGQPHRAGGHRARPQHGACLSGARRPDLRRSAGPSRRAP
jgi:hypothetical protein